MSKTEGLAKASKQAADFTARRFPSGEMGDRMPLVFAFLMFQRYGGATRRLVRGVPPEFWKGEAAGASRRRTPLEGDGCTGG